MTCERARHKNAYGASDARMMGISSVLVEIYGCGYMRSMGAMLLARDLEAQMMAISRVLIKCPIRRAMRSMGATLLADDGMPQRQIMKPDK